MNDINEAIRTWRKVLNTITKIPMNMILSGESIRGPELVTIKNNQKVPIGYDEDCIIHYVDPTTDLNVIDTSTDMKLIQSYELHLVIYGNNCKSVATKIITNLYTDEALELLREGGIGILKIDPLENTSEFLTTNTYVLRYDIKIQFNCQIEPERAFEQTEIEEADQDIIKNN
jgi:hypothetical protein